MRPSQCKTGMRIFTYLPGRTIHGVIHDVFVNPASSPANRVRRVLVRWDGLLMPVEVDPADLKREIPAPIGDRDALERWLDSE